MKKQRVRKLRAVTPEPNGAGKVPVIQLQMPIHHAALLAQVCAESLSVMDMIERHVRGIDQGALNERRALVMQMRTTFERASAGPPAEAPTGEPAQQEADA